MSKPQAAGDDERTHAGSIEPESVATAQEALSQPPVIAANAVLGIGMMLLGIFLFVVNDVVGKWLVATYTVGQVLMIRSVAGLVMLSPLMRREGLTAFLAPNRPRLQLFRVLLSSLEVACFYTAVIYLPLATVVTIYLAGPIYVTALAGPLLGEKVGWRRWCAVLVGFVGVIIALQPSAETFQAPSLIAIGGSLLFAVLMIVTRKLRGTSDTVLVTYQTISALVLGAVLAPFHWVTPTPRDLALLAMLGVVATIAHLCVNRALKLAPAAVVVPYQYTQIAWAVLLGWLVFGDTPATAVFVGSGVIVAAGLYIFLREQTLARRDAARKA
jgi:drug/metabolite transporter (DMT)-like permease